MLLSRRLLAKGYLKKETVRLKITNRNWNKLMRIFKGFLFALIFLSILECSTVPAESDSSWIGYTESGADNLKLVDNHLGVSSIGMYIGIWNLTLNLL